MADLQPAPGRVVSVQRFKDLRPLIPRYLLDEIVAKKLYTLLAGETILDDSLPADVLTCPEAGQGNPPSPEPPGVPPVAPGWIRTL
jgi:hypothetical protein